MDDQDLTVEQAPAGGAVENVAVLDLTSIAAAEDLARITNIKNVAVVLIPESLAGALAGIPTHNVASVVPVPDGAEARVHTGSVVTGGEVLAYPAGEDAVLVVTGTLALSSPVERVAFSRVVVTGMVLAPQGSEAALGPGLTRVTGSVQYYRFVESQQFKTLSGQQRLSGEPLANDGGAEGDLLFVAGQTIITSPVPRVGYQRVVPAGQLVAPRVSEAARLIGRSWLWPLSHT